MSIKTRGRAERVEQYKWTFRNAAGTRTAEVIKRIANDYYVVLTENSNHVETLHNLDHNTAKQIASHWCAVGALLELDEAV